MTGVFCWTLRLRPLLASSLLSLSACSLMPQQNQSSGYFLERLGDHLRAGPQSLLHRWEESMQTPLQKQKCGLGVKPIVRPHDGLADQGRLIGLGLSINCKNI